MLTVPFDADVEEVSATGNRLSLNKTLKDKNYMPQNPWKILLKITGV